MSAVIREYMWNPNTLLGTVVIGLLCLLAAFILSRLLDRLFSRGQWVMGRLGRKVDDTVVRYVKRVANLLVFITAGLVFVSLVPGLDGLFRTLLASAGVTALVFGFAAKSTLSNFISGMSLAVYRPFRIGDKVEIEGKVGTVEDITLRHTIVRTWRHERLIIPNEKIDNMTLVNYSIIDQHILCTVQFGVSYDTDLDLARRLILEEAEACPHIDASHPDKPWVRVIAHQDFAIGLRFYAWVKNKDDDWLTQYWMLERVKKRFDAEGVEIPFPYRTLVYKKDLPPPAQPPKE